MPRESRAVLNVRPADPTEVRAALRCTLAQPRQTPAEVERQIDLFLRYTDQLHLEVCGHWLALDRGGWVGACTCIASPGRTATLLLPADFAAPSRRAATAALLDAAAAACRERGLRLVQVLTDSAQPDARAAFPSGFIRLAALEYLECRTSDVNRRPAVPKTPAVCWRSYAEAPHAWFAETIAATYQGSRDCPGLTGLRHIEEVIAGHRSAALFNPHHWFLLCSEERPVGCILLGEVPLRSALEVVYMGLVPAARGRGWGELLVMRALETARRGHLAAVTLAVDSRNEPARRLYARVGFRLTMTREAWICSLSSVSAEDSDGGSGSSTECSQRSSRRD